MIDFDNITDDQKNKLTFQLAQVMMAAYSGMKTMLI